MSNTAEDITDPMVPKTTEHPQGLGTCKEGPQRESWHRHLDYMLTMVGYCVGLSNLLRFPYICNRNGGGAFLIPFIVCLLVAGFPMFFLEAAISQFSGKAVKQVWSFCPMFQGIGTGCVVLTFFYMPYYNLYLAWPIYYMVRSCSSVLPWTTCSNSWNTDLCVEDLRNVTHSSNNGASPTVNITAPVLQLWENGTLAHSAAEEFWQYRVLSISTGLDDVGSVQWHIVGCLFASLVLIFLCLIHGIRSAGKVVYVTALLPYILLLSIFITTLLKPGATDGLLYFLVPDFKQLLDIQVWLEACLQVFFSLGPGWGMIGTAASYKKFHEPCMRDCLILTLVSEGTSIFSGLVTFAVLGVMAQKTGVPIANVVSTGPGLGFVTYPDALAQLPLPQLWSFLFFLMLLMVGLDSEFMGTEVVVTALVDQYPQQLGKRRMLVTAGVCLTLFLIGIVFCTQGGPYMFQLMDWYEASLAPMLFCTLECFAVGCIYGIKQMIADVEMMLGKSVSPVMKVLLVFVTPAILTIAFILTLLRYQPPTYGRYEFPRYASTIGWIIAVLPLLPIPVYMVKTVRKHMATNSLMKSVSLALRPADDWLPADVRYTEEYRMQRLARRSTFKSNIVDMFKQ